MYEPHTECYVPVKTLQIDWNKVRYEFKVDQRVQRAANDERFAPVTTIDGLVGKPPIK
jgi:hypothetical protein